MPMPTDPSSAPDTPPTPRPYARRTAWLVLGLGLLIGGAWLLGTPPGILGKADAIGYAICHRILTRSFHVHDRALPLCARCTGITWRDAGRARLRLQRAPAGQPLPRCACWRAGAVWRRDRARRDQQLPVAVDFYRSLRANQHAAPDHGLYAGLTMITVVVPVFNMSAWRDAILRDAADPARAGRAVRARRRAIVATLADVAALRSGGLVSVAGVVLMFTLTVACYS